MAAHRQLMTGSRPLSRGGRDRAWTAARGAILVAGLFAGLYADLQQVAFTARPPAFVVADLIGGWSFLVAGTIAWQRRPSNRIGRLLVLVGLSWFVGSYGLVGGETSGHLARSFQGWFEPLLAWVVLAYPSGRLGSRPARFLVGAWFADQAAWSIAQLILARPLSWYPCLTCRETVDAFTSNARTLEALGPLSLGVSVLLAASVVGLLLVRFKRNGAGHAQAPAPCALRRLGARRQRRRDRRDPNRTRSWVAQRWPHRRRDLRRRHAGCRGGPRRPPPGTAGARGRCQADGRAGRCRWSRPSPARARCPRPRTWRAIPRPAVRRRCRRVRRRGWISGVTTPHRPGPGDHLAGRRRRCRDWPPGARRRAARRPRARGRGDRRAPAGGGEPAPRGRGRAAAQRGPGLAITDRRRGRRGAAARRAGPARRRSAAADRAVDGHRATAFRREHVPATEALQDELANLGGQLETTVAGAARARPRDPPGHPGRCRAAGGDRNRLLSRYGDPGDDGHRARRPPAGRGRIDRVFRRRRGAHERGQARRWCGGEGQHPSGAIRDPDRRRG